MIRNMLSFIVFLLLPIKCVPYLTTTYIIRQQFQKDNRESDERFEKERLFFEKSYKIFGNFIQNLQKKT